MTPGLVSVVVLNWNGKAVIEACLESLLHQTYRPVEIIVIDNGSTDGSGETIKKKYAASKPSSARRNASSDRRNTRMPRRFCAR